MTPEEYERYKNAEKEHLRKLKELTKAVRVLERQQKIKSSLEDISRSSADALEAQKDAVDRLAMETAQDQARLEVALDSVTDEEPSVLSTDLDEELKKERARALVQEIRSSLAGDSSPLPESRQEEPNDGSSRMNFSEGDEPDPTPDLSERPDKTIGRM